MIRLLHGIFGTIFFRKKNKKQKGCDTLVTLVKGGNISLSKEAPGLSNIVVGLGWDVRSDGGDDFDLDASIFMLGENGKMRSKEDLVYYGRLKSKDGSIVHTGDNLTGEGDGDDEQLMVDLSRVPFDVQQLAVTVSIYKAADKKQNFGMVSNAFVRIVEGKMGREIARYDLGSEFSNECSVIFGEVYRKNGEWKFKAVGQGIKGELPDLLTLYS